MVVGAVSNISHVRCDHTLKCRAYFLGGMAFVVAFAVTGHGRAQVVISGAQSTAQSLDALAGGSATMDAMVSSGAVLNVPGSFAITGGTRAWSLVNNGSIAGTTGISLSSGGSVTNLGSISSTATNGAGATFSGISILGGNPAVVDNAGTITTTANGPRTGIEFTNVTTGMITNRAGASITVGSFGGTPSAGIMVNSATGSVSVVNAGTITARDGIVVNSAGSVVNQATGIINGSPSGIGIALDNGTIQNAGTVTGPVSISSGGGLITNTGRITAARPGTSAAHFFGSGDSTLINGGTISDSNGSAVTFGAGNDTLVLRRGSAINGTVQGGGGNNQLVLEGASLTTTANLMNFNNTLIARGSGSSVDGPVSFAQTSVSGELAVNSVLTSPVAIAAGGRLSGSGAVSGNVSNTAGTVSPGNAIGTLTVNGSFTQVASGTLAIAVSPGAASRLAVNGAASLGGALAITADPGSYAVGTRYQVLTASGGINGTFAQTTVASSSPLLQFNTVYQSNAVDIAVQVGSVAAIVGSGNQQSVGAALDRAASSPGFAPVIGALVGLSSAAAIQGAVDQLGTAAEGYGGMNGAALNVGRNMAGVLAQQLSLAHTAAGETTAFDPRRTRVQLASLDPIPAVGPSRWSAWADGFGVFGGVAGDGNAHAVDYRTGGTAIGADYRLDPNLLVGAMAGFADTETSASGLPGVGTIRSYSLALYGSWTRDRLYADGMLGYAYNDIHLTRGINVAGLPAMQAKGETEGHQLMSAMEVGRNFSLGSGARATPLAGLHVNVLHQAAFTEAGAGALNLAVRDDTTASVRSLLGSRFDIDTTVDGVPARFTAKLAWGHEFADTSQSVRASFAGAPAGSFALQSARANRDSAQIGLGAAARLDRDTSLHLRYEADLNGHNDSHAVIAGLRLTW